MTRSQDVKRPGKISDGIMHSVVDDHCRLAWRELMSEEKDLTRAQVLAGSIDLTRCDDPLARFSIVATLAAGRS